MFICEKQGNRGNRYEMREGTSGSGDRLYMIFTHRKDSQGIERCVWIESYKNRKEAEADWKWGCN